MIPGLAGLRGLMAEAAGPSGPDANTVFLCRFNTATPTDEISTTAGTLVGNANCDTANSQLVTDGTGDWVTFNGATISDEFSSGDTTMELHTNIAAAQVCGLVSRSASGPTRYALYCHGTGTLSFYMDRYSTSVPLLTAAGALDGTEKHIAIVRNGLIWRMYVSGVQVNSFTTTLAPENSTNNLYVAADIAATASRDVACRIGRLKFSNVARYPSGTTFTPPSRTDA